MLSDKVDIIFSATTACTLAYDLHVNVGIRLVPHPIYEADVFPYIIKVATSTVEEYRKG